MSVRSLIEINHDFTWRLDDPAFVSALRRYLASASSQTAADLKHFGVHVISRRHHLDRYYVGANTDGFPVAMRAARTPPEQPTTSPLGGDERTPAAEPQSGERENPSENTHAE